MERYLELMQQGCPSARRECREWNAEVADAYDSLTDDQRTQLYLQRLKEQCKKAGVEYDVVERLTGTYAGDEDARQAIRQKHPGITFQFHTANAFDMPYFDPPVIRVVYDKGTGRIKHMNVGD